MREGKRVRERGYRRMNKGVMKGEREGRWEEGSEGGKMELGRIGV